MKEKSNKILVASIIFSSVLLSASIVFLGLQLNPQQTNDMYQEYRDSIKPDTKNNDAVLGSMDAPLTMVEYSDYQCPYCRKYFEETYPRIKSEYIDKGLLKVIFKDFPLPGHPDGIIASNAAECAREQSNDATYYAFHNAVFKSQGSWKQGTVGISKENLFSIVEELGLDSEKFNSCFNQNKYHDEIIADIFAGEKAGIQATPTFIVNGTYIEGALEFEEFKKIFDAILNE